MRRAIRIRLRLLSGILFVFAALIVLRLYFVQVVHGADYALRAEKQYISASQELFSRGTIYFTRKDGSTLSAATLTNGFTVAMNPEQLSDPEEAYAKLAALVPLEYAAFMESAGAKDDPYEVVAKRVPEDVGEQIQALKIPGIRVERDRWRSYPAGAQAAQSIGFVAFDNDNTIEGRYGLERYYEDILSRDNEGLFGNFFAELFASLDSVMMDAREAKEGDLVTTIEPMVQEKLDQVLREVNAQYGSVETAGIIMDPATGEIIALDTVPSFDPNDFANGDPAHFGNPLVEHQYEFGSIVKALTMAAGLDAGVITPDSTYEDRGCMELNNKKFCNYDLKARGTTPMQEVLSQSLNMGATHIALKVGHERFREYFKELGMGEETGIDLPSEVPGNINNILNSPRDVEYATASFGQGVAQTPVEMVKALGALANEGKVVTPHLVRAVKLESGIEKKLSWGGEERVFSKEATLATTRMLVKVVDDKLDGGKVKIPEMSVAAKTGTAQVAGPGGKYYENLYLHSFFGYFPAYEPRFIILLYTREPQGVQYASETLTHPFMELTQFLINYYELPPDRADVP